MKVLVVEDNALTGDVLTRLLAAAGHEVVWAANGSSALTRLDVFRPDAIVLDHLLGDMDGEFFLRQLRAREETARTPVVFATAVAGLELSLVEAVAAADGRAWLVRKPYTAEQLEAVLRCVADPAPVKEE